MTFWAWAVFLLVTGYTIWDGVRRTIGARSLEDFFAAKRSIPWWASGLSVMATQLSAITIIGGIGMGYENGLEWVQFYFALPFAMVLLCIFIVPMYRQNPILTAYQYLEGRFGPGTRSLTSAAFLVSRCLAFGIVLYAPSVVFSVMTGLPITWTVIVVGTLTTLYTAIGGVGGVVWTDVKQMMMIVIGILMCLGILLWSLLQQMSPLSLLQVLGASGRMNAVEVADPSWTFVPAASGGTGGSFWRDKYNLWTGLFGTLFLFLSYFGCDQVQVQSILTAPTADGSRRALLVSAFTKIPLQLVVLFMGGLLFLFTTLGDEQLLFDPSQRTKALTTDQQQRLVLIEREHTAAAAERKQLTLQLAALADPPALHTDLVRRYHGALDRAKDARRAARELVFEAEKKSAEAEGATFEVPSDSNYIFPHYIFHHLPGPLLGLMLAAIFAAAISSAAGALSSLTSATVVDFYHRFVRRPSTGAHPLLASRVIMMFWGGAATLAAVYLGNKPLLERVNEIGSWFYGSILGVFVLALAAPRAGGIAASAGLIGGLLTVFVVHSTLEFAFLWYNLIGCAGCVLIGWLTSLAWPRIERNPLAPHAT